MMKPAVRLVISTFNMVWVLFLCGCSPVPLQKDLTVAGVMDEVTHLIYTTMEKDEINSLGQNQVMELLDDDQLEVLSKRHLVFDVNVPSKVYVMRSKSQKVIPFWLEPSGFTVTGMEMKNDYHTYEVWHKDVEPGTVELGINGFENFSYHYFVAVAPQDTENNLELSVKLPENQYIGILEEGAFTYHDWTELELKDVPPEMVGHKLLTTIRGRGKESHLVGAFRTTNYKSSSYPDQVMLTWSTDPATSVDIQWRTDTTINSGEVKYRATGSADVSIADAAGYLMEDRELMNDRFIYRFTAKLRNLEPGTNYEYLIAPGSDWENACTFNTPTDNDSFSFIWFGDVHNKPEFGELLNLAEKNHPEAAFYTIAGDHVDDGLYRNQWDELFEYSKDVMCNKPFMNVPGNHDNRLGLGANMYRNMFSYPANGPADVPKEQTYSFVYKNTLFLMLDATSGVENQTAWIEEQLAETDASWKIAVFHFPPYNWEEPYPDIQKEWIPVFDKYHVDMVFSGHIHYYMRTKPMKGGQVVDSYNNGTTYIISLGIPGRSEEISDEPYAAVRDKSGWLYQYIRIDENTLNFRSVNRKGRTIDEFSIVK